MLELSELKEMYDVVAGYTLLEESKKSGVPYEENKEAQKEAVKYADHLVSLGLIPEMYCRILLKRV